MEIAQEILPVDASLMAQALDRPDIVGTTLIRKLYHLKSATFEPRATTADNVDLAGHSRTKSLSFSGLVSGVETTESLELQADILLQRPSRIAVQVARLLRREPPKASAHISVHSNHQE